MFSHRSAMALLTVLTLSAKVAVSAIVAPASCTIADVGTGFCLNCKTKAECQASGSAPVSTGDCTVPGEACTVLAGIATCKPFAETACSCEKPSQCDAYNHDWKLICLSGGLTISEDCTVGSTVGDTCVDGDCVASFCTGQTDGFHVILPKCTTAAYCVSGALVDYTEECASGTYLDMDENACMPIPPVPCAGCDTGACPDKSDCSKWYICDGGMVLSEETCITGEQFDTSTNDCIPVGAICTLNDKCNLGQPLTADTTTTSETTTTIETTTTAVTATTTLVSSSDGSSTGVVSDSTTSETGSTSDSSTTTSRPAECTADNVGQRYPYEGNCKMYWTCIEVSNGKYDYVASTCLGDLVFNADTGYCDTPANVDGCVPTS